MSKGLLNTQPLRRRKKYEELIEHIVEGVHSGEFAPGTLLPSEDVLRNRYGVGKLAVREAILALERMGITKFVPGQGAIVLVPQVENLMDGVDAAALQYLGHDASSHEKLREARLLIEIDIAKLVVQNATDEDLDRLQRVIDEGDEVQDNRGAYLEANRRFHSCLSEIAQNPFMATLQMALLRWVESFPATRVHVPGSDAKSQADHRAILVALKSRDMRAVEEEVRRHLLVDYSMSGKLDRIAGAEHTT